MPDKQTYKRVSDILEDNKWKEYSSLKFEDIEGKDVVIHDFIYKSGEHGNFAVILCSYLDSPDKFTIVTGSTVVLNRLNALNNKRAIPCVGTFFKPEGKSYYNLQ